jgi:hypothetical protein
MPLYIDIERCGSCSFRSTEWLKVADSWRNTWIYFESERKHTYKFCKKYDLYDDNSVNLENYCIRSLH